MAGGAGWKREQVRGMGEQVGVAQVHVRLADLRVESRVKGGFDLRNFIVRGLFFCFCFEGGR